MALELQVPNAQSKECSFKKLHKKLNEEDKETLSSWIDNGVSSYKIFQALKRDGHAIGRQTIYEHMNGWCTCGTKRHD